MAERKPVDKRPIKDLLHEKDAFLTTSEKIQEYFLRHTRGFIIGAAAVALIVVAGALYSYYRESAELKATLAYEAALKLPSEGRIEALEKLRSSHDGRKAARLAGYNLAALYSAEGRLPEALSLSQELLATLPQAEEALRPLLLYHIAGLAEASGDQELARQNYEILAGLSQIPAELQQSVLLALGRVRTAAGQGDEAAQYYERLLREFPGGPQVNLAALKLAELRAASAKPESEAAPEAEPQD